MERDRTARRPQQDLWDRIWRDKRGKIVIYQNPNIWLIAWAVLAFISMVVPRGKTSDIVWWASTIVLAFWALLELFRGVNYFRRALGAFILLITIAGALGLGR
jgi:hypothetical protein